MAGDWIKMRVGLVTHPKVLALSDALSYSEAYQEWSGLYAFVPSVGGSQKELGNEVAQALRVTRYVTVTALLRFWGYANEHAKDDFIASLRISDIDEIAGIPGFGAALSEIGWAIYDTEKRGVSLPNFSEHNATACDRGAAERQKRYREKKKLEADSHGVTGDVTRHVTPLHREEKRRVKNITPFGFDEFWEAYGKKVGRKKSIDEWRKHSVDAALLTTILDAATAYAASTEPKFRKDPERWIKDMRWLDGATAADRFAGVV